MTMESGPGSLVLRVDATWDGEPLPAAEAAVLRLCAGADPDTDPDTGPDAGPDHLRLTVDAPFHGDPPPPGPPGPTPGLWHHEVVELFVAGAGSGAPEVAAGVQGKSVVSPAETIPYVEIELSPHGHHLVLRLAGVRRVVGEGLPMRFRSRIDGVRWHGEAWLPRRWLSPAPHRVNAFALHGEGSARRYLAAVPLPPLRPGDEPDFHQPHRFPRAVLPAPAAGGVEAR